MSLAINVRNLSKLYRISHQKPGNQSLRESLWGLVAQPCSHIWQAVRDFGRAGSHDQGGGSDAANDELWALKDITFDVKEGEVIGIVGRNGAGKSTLLKIFSRITQPTTGRIELSGRVGSLLEVGTGFHPELSGRENIFLNGAILGMPRREITRKFDEIVAFAEIERFLDTPVKRYSSGMYTRLAFAVASHLEPDILIVDEVLAVGDAAFQKKCLGRMSQVSREGRTVLFVSHNVVAVKSLCTRAILLEKGQITLNGTVDDVIDRYLNDGDANVVRTGVNLDHVPRISDTKDEALIRSVRLTDLDGNDINQLYFGQPFRVGMLCDVTREIDGGHFEVSVSTADGVHVTYSTTIDGGVEPLQLPVGRHEVWAQFDSILLPRQYTIDVGVHHHNGLTADFVPRSLDFNVVRVAETGNDHYRWQKTRGLVRATAKWELQHVAPA